MRINKIWFLELLFGKIDDSIQRGLWLLRDFIQNYKLFLFLLLIVGVLIGLIEGAAIGLLALSVIVIAGETTECVAPLVKVSDYLPIDLCDGYNKYDVFIYIVVISIFVQIFKSLVVYTSSYLSVILRTRVGFDIKARTFQHMMHLSYQEMNKYPVGELKTLFNISNALSKLVFVLNEFMTIFFILSTYMLILIAMNWQLTIFSVFLLLVMVVFVLPFLERMKKLSRKVRENAVEIENNITDYLFAMRLIKLYGKGAEVLESVKNLVRIQVGIKRRMALLKLAIPNIQETVLVVTIAIVLLVSFYTAGREEAETVLPQVLAYLLVLNRCNARVIAMNAVRSGFSIALAELEFLANFLRYEGKSVDRLKGDKVQSDWQEITLKDVSFTYDESDETVLDAVNLSIQRGERVAFVGQSGSGKSTLVDLVVGLLEPSKGKILMDKQASSTATKASWMQQFSMVSQNDLILDGSVRENLMFANEKASDEDLIEACKLANAHDFILEMENGYDSFLGERGYRVSGGQKQRIAFARAILKGAPILVLDEATSALDTVSEKKIIDALNQSFENITMIMIAHRLSTVVDVDRIYVLDAGRIVDQGSHKELMNRPGLYKSMWNLQVGEK